jgi:ketosteroid isomerase-like protein
MVIRYFSKLIKLIIMKYLYVVLLSIFFSFSSIAQSKNEKAVAAAVEKLRKAMIDGDGAALESVAAENLSYGHSGGSVENKAAFVEHIAGGKSDFVTIELSEQTISVNDKFAVVRHTLNAATNDNNKPGIVKLKVLLVWHKEKGEWRLWARQAVKLT